MRNSQPAKQLFSAFTDAYLNSKDFLTNDEAETGFDSQMVED